MASSSKMVKLVESTRVNPCFDSPKPLGELTLPLTLFDLYWFKFPPVDYLFFYQLTESDSTPSYFYSRILPTLKHSLSLALAHYLPLAGKLKWPEDSPKPILSYAPNDGVSLTVAESASSLDTLSSNGIRTSNELHPLVPPLTTSDDEADTISVQITLFPDQGFSVGLTTHHAVLDGRSTVTFMKAWAYLCNRVKPNPTLPTELTPFLDRNVVKDPARLDMHYLNNWVAKTISDSDNPNKRSLKLMHGVITSTTTTADDLVRATFEYSREDINKLREKSKRHHLSRFVLTLAYTTTCLVKAKAKAKGSEEEGDDDWPVGIAFVADCRARLDPPLPLTYFGNCIMGFHQVTRATHLMNEKSGLGFALDLCSGLVERLNDGVLKGALEKMKEVSKAKLEPGLQIISVAGSPQFGFYEVDYGFGKPKKVEIVSIDRNGAVSMVESRDGSGGVEIGLAMKKHEMENFASLFFQGLTMVDN